jgi:hypothetical protein
MLDNYFHPMLFPFHTENDLLRGTRAEVVFGVLEKGCRGLGVCKLLPVQSLKPSCSTAKAIIDTPEEGVIRFHFNAKILCARLKDYQFANDFFTVEADFELPDFIRTRLGLDTKHIKKGLYPIEKKQNYITVFFYYS